MRNLMTHIRQSLALKLSIGILLMAVPVFLVAMSVLFVVHLSKKEFYC